MNEQIRKSFATKFVHLILAGRHTIEDVPAALQELVKADLKEAAPNTQAAERATTQNV
ncbi:MULTISPECIES: CD1375 family protein [Paenibacillus]|uniref:CD1375 family protein n=1 Tax=Paenibacillus TaxID=44249 RepID=UPI000A3F3826|nr:MULTISPECIES: CD1375 family protein [Paenibacillus]